MSKILIDREVVEQALRVLDNNFLDDFIVLGDVFYNSIDALRAALEQPEQEPVAWHYVGIRHDDTTHGPHLVWKPEYMDAMSAIKGAKATPLYASPPRREWQGLTDEERTDLWWQVDMKDMPEHGYGKAIEAKLKEKNGL